MANRPEKLGLLFAALCAGNGAFVPAFAKLTTDLGDPLFVATATTVIAGLLSAVVLGAQRKLAPLFARGTGWRLALIGALGTALAFFLFFSGARRASAIETTLCLQIEPVYSLLLARVFLGHRPGVQRIAAVFLLLAGITLAVGARGMTGSVGVLFLLATPICWQVSHLIVLRGLPKVDVQVITGARYIHGGFVLVFLWAVSGGFETIPAAENLAKLVPLLILQGLILSYVGTLLWYQAITRLDLARATAVVVPSIPVLSLVASYALLGETPSVAQWMGITLTAGGVLAFATAPRPAILPAADKRA